MRTFLVSLIGAAAVVASVAALRSHREADLAPREVEIDQKKSVPAGETHPGTLSLERIRELGL